MAGYQHTYADAFEQDPFTGGYGFLVGILDLAEYEPLLTRLQQYRHTGRPGYPISAMWRAFLVKHLLSIRYNVELVARLRVSPILRRVCGFDDAAPTETAICRFFKRLTRHQDLVDEAIAAVVSRLKETIDASRQSGELPRKAPPVGAALAIDSTDIEAWVDVQKKPYSDQSARWGYRTNPDAPDGKEFFYGYKLHLVCDAYYGVPLTYEALPANQSDSPTLPGLVDKVAATHSSFKTRYLIADKGYDALSNYRHLDQLGIIPVIPLRNTDRNGIYDQKGRPLCFGNQPMEYVGTEYVGTDPEQGHLFRCRKKGCHLEDRIGLTLYCDIEYHEDLEGDALRKVGPLVRTTGRWKRLYKWRPIIERSFHSLKHSRLLNQHRYRGLAKVRLHAALALLTYCATMLARAQAGDYDLIRRMRIRLPVVKPVEQMRLAV